MRVLITSASRKVSLIKAFQDAGAYVIAVDANSLSPALYFADEYHISPRDETIVDFLLNIEHDVLVPTRDAELEFFSHTKDIFPSLVLTPDYLTVVMCRDKKQFCQFLDISGYSQAKMYPLPNRVLLPAFARPRTGAGSNGVLLIDSFEGKNWETIETSWDNYVVQKYIDSLPEYTVDLFATREQVISVIPRRRVQVTNGESWTGITENNPIIINECKRLATDLRLLYHNTIQCFYNHNTQEVLFTEVNPRFGGGFVLGVEAGANTPKYILDIAQGKEVKPLGEFTDKLTMVRYTQDYFIQGS